MEPRLQRKLTYKKESRFQRWFNNFFCLQSDTDSQSSTISLKQKTCKPKPKQFITMSLLGSYKNSILCKISRRNFVVNQNELDSQRLPTLVSKYIGDKLSSTSVVIQGNISKIMVSRIPLIFRMYSQGQKIDKKAEYLHSSIQNLKIRLDDFAIFRPKFPSNYTPCLLDSDESVTKEIFSVTTKFRNSILILPKSTSLDEIGLVLSSVPKYVQVETIVANGSPLCIVVYVGSKQFVFISEEQQLSFVAKQLKKDLVEDSTHILSLVQKIYQRSSLADVLFLLRKSINQADVDTICSCFIRNAVFRNYVTNEEVSQLVPSIPNQIEIPNTASFRLTARFNFVHSETFKRSYSDDLLNGENGELNYENEVETFAGSGASINGIELTGDYTPYDDNE